MEQIKYATNNRDFAAELRTKVKEYFNQHQIESHGNGTIVLKTVLMSLIYILPYAILLSGIITSTALMMCCWVLIGMGAAGLGMVTMHDANHGSYSKKASINKFVSKSLYLLGGFPPNWRYQHNTLHHGYTNIDGHDEDIAPIGILRFSPHQPLKKIHRFQHIYAWFLYGLMTFSWVTAKDFKRFINYSRKGAVLSSKKSFNRLLADLILSKLLYYIVFLALPLILLPFAWYWIVLGFLAMLFTSGLILSTIFQSAHVVPSSSYPLPNENLEINNNWMVHQFYTTADFSPKSKVFSWCIGGLNYQVIHHLFPNISHVHYKNIAPIVRETAKKYGIPYFVSRNFMGALTEHYRMLKKLGHLNPPNTWRVTQPVPESTLMASVR